MNIKNITLSFALLSGFANAGHYDLNEWSNAVGGTSMATELHVIKNNGMDSHVVYRCSEFAGCVDEWATIAFNNNNMIKQAWFQEYNKKIALK